MKFKPIDTHGFGERIYVKPIKKDRVKYVKVKAVPEPENENVKQLKETWDKIKIN